MSTNPRITMTRWEFRSTPDSAFAVAEKYGALDIVDDNGRVLATLCSAPKGDDDLSAAEKRCCDAAVAQHKAELLYVEALGRGKTVEDRLAAVAAVNEARDAALAAGAELARLWGAK
jgi:hypothetical protein